MSKLRLKISMSVDVFRESRGLGGGEVDASTAVVEASLANIGATIMGLNIFGGHPGPWSAADPWTGWWGPDPPFHHPVFVLTHHARAPLPMQGGTTFTFVTDGIESALAQARAAVSWSIPGSIRDRFGTL